MVARKSSGRRPSRANAAFSSFSADSFYAARRNLSILLGKAVVNGLEAQFGRAIKFSELKIVNTVSAYRIEILGLFADDPTGNDFVMVEVDPVQDYDVVFTFERDGKNVEGEVPITHFGDWYRASVSNLGGAIAKLVGERLRRFLASR